MRAARGRDGVVVRLRRRARERSVEEEDRP